MLQFGKGPQSYVYWLYWVTASGGKPSFMASAVLHGLFVLHGHDNYYVPSSNFLFRGYDVIMM
jgi:hypothetical protein